jgi:hypothetical protein
VQEDGATAPVTGVVPLEQGDEPISVVLVIDRSGSMRGTPIRDARRAAVDFVGEMRVIDRVGVVSFDDYVTVISRLSSDKEALGKAIEGITVGAQRRHCESPRVAFPVFGEEGGGHPDRREGEQEYGNQKGGD